MRDNGIPAVLDTLTPKQREVLDLLIAHKTSKEIARQLGISPYTVDQRITFAKSKLGVESRGEVALAYRRLVEASGAPLPASLPQTEYANGDPEISEPTAYEESRSVSPSVPFDQGGARNGEYLIAPRPQERGQADERPNRSSGYKVVPEIFEGPYGTSARLAMIAILAIGLLFAALGGIALYDQLSRVLRG